MVLRADELPSETPIRSSTARAKVEAEGLEDTEMGFLGNINDAVTARLVEQMGNVVHEIYSPLQVSVELAKSS